MNTLLEVSGVSVSFDGFKAINNLSMQIGEPELRAIIGPNGAYAGDDFLLGLFLLGPGLNYPNHAHPAPELYWILSGMSDWRVRDEEFSPREPGETIWHEPYVPHATNVGLQPMLAAYMWTKDVKQGALLV